MKVRSILYSLLLLAFSCKKENALDCFKSNGKEISEVRVLGIFNEVSVADKIDLKMVQGNEYKVEVFAGENIIKNVQVTNTDGKLHIKNNNKCNFVRGYKKHISVRVTTPSIAKVESRGVGTITFENDFVQDMIFVYAENSGDIHLSGTFRRIKTGSHGNGDIYLKGMCDTLTVYAFGTNSTKAKDLKVNTYTFVENISVGDVRLTAPLNGTLEVKIWKAGNIYYTGNPAIVTDYSDGSGKGNLIKE